MTLPTVNTVWPLAKEGFLHGVIDVAAADVSAYLLDASYGYDPTQQFVADLGATIITNGISALLTGLDVGNGVATCSPNTATFTDPAGVAKAMAIAQNTGTPATDLLFGLIVQNADTTPMDETFAGGVKTYTFATNLFYI